MLVDRRTVVGGLLVAPVIIGSVATVVAAKEAIANPAEIMHKSLMLYGVEILPIDAESIKKGMRLGLPPTNGGEWTQRHVDGDVDKFDAEIAIGILSGHIAHTFRSVRFGHLFIPSKGCMDANRHTFGDVTVRNLSSYSPWVDDEGRLHDKIMRRLDVLFVGDPR